MAASAFTIRLQGIDELQAALEAGGKSKTWAQQAINRAGEAERGWAAKRIREAIPVKLSVIRARVRWSKLDKSGNGGMLRLYGAGKGASAWIRPRNMRPKYSTIAPTRNGGRFTKLLGKAARKAAATSYGVGGAFPEAAKRVVDRGFVMSVDEGPTFYQAWQHGFKREKSLVFQRKGRGRSIVNQRGVTVGTAAQRLGLIDVLSTRISERATNEYLKRVEREMAAKARKG